MSRIVLVTGAAGGIGAAISRRFAEVGDEVLGWDVVPSPGTTVVDVASDNEVSSALAEVDRLDVVVHAAGVVDRLPLAQSSAASWDAVIAVNLLGAANLARHAHAALSRSRGTFMVVGSVSSASHLRDRSAYQVSKSALETLVASLAVEWAPDGMRALCVHPGFTRTEMLQRGIDSGSFSEELVARQTPLGRLLEPDEVADAIVALCGDSFRAVNGASLLVDGGYAAWGSRI